jgi:glutaminyl-peptide cyclotransferase
LRIVAAVLAVLLIGTPALAEVPTQGFDVVRDYPHDEEAFTEGLFFQDGTLYESTGLYPSFIRQVRLETGEVMRERELSTVYFGEGIVALGDRLYSLTWRNHIGFIWKLDDFSPLGGFSYPGEGWGLTTDGARLVMSDGTDQIRFLDPTTLAETGRISVTADGRPLDQINELEWVDGEILANIWQDTRIARIDPATGQVKAFIDLASLVPTGPGVDPNDDVANGIAWDAAGQRLFVTGKRWPKLYEIRLKPLG